MSQCIAVTSIHHYYQSLCEPYLSTILFNFIFADFIFSFPDYGCIHSLRGRLNEQCTGVRGSFEGHIFRFRSGQVATIENFNQRCALLLSAGILKQDPMYRYKQTVYPESWLKRSN